MSERLNTRDLADVLSVQTGMDKKDADVFINTLSSYISQRIEKNKSVRVLGLGTFKVVLVRERESVHIQTGERFIIPAHHKLSFVPDKDFKEHINRPFAFFEPIETIEEERKPKKVTFNIDNVADNIISDQDETIVDDVIDLDEVINNTQDSSNETDEDLAVPAGAAVLENQISNDYFSSEEYDSVSLEEFEEKDVFEEIKDYVLTEAEETEDFVEPVSIDETDEKDENDETDDIDESDIATIINSRIKTDDSSDEKVEPVISHKSPEMKKKIVPSWFLYLVIPVLAFLGSFLAVYLFLYYNSDKASVNDRPLNVLTYEPDSFEDTPMQEENVGISDTGITENISTTDGFTFPDSSGDRENNEVIDSVFSTTQSVASEKKVEKTTIDWLALSPETSTQTKRANKPNEEIERKNRDLSKNATSGTGTTQAGNARNSDAGIAKVATTGTNATQQETKEKIIPAKIRMTAGSSLRDIAQQYYGDRAFWVYIYEYNRDKIKNYNNIPVGTEIRLPLPRTYGINANNKSSVQKAEQKQTELYRSNPGN